MNGSKDPQLRWLPVPPGARADGAVEADEAQATFPADAGAFTARFQELRGDLLLAKGDRPGALREYLAPRRSSPRPDSEVTLDLAGLDLKISDLRADGVTEAAKAAAPVATMAG